MLPLATLTINPAIDVSASTEEVFPTRKLRCTTVRREPGGGGINVARVVRRLGSDVCAVYPVGGASGQLLRQLIERENMQSITIDVTDETREDFTIFEQKTGDQYRFVLPGPQLAEHEWQACLSALASFDIMPPIVVGSGSLPPGVPDDFYSRAAQITKSRNSRMILDASGKSLAAALAEGVYLVKPSLRELRELLKKPLPDEKSWLSAGRSIVEAGQAEVVALTLGAEGALLVTRDMALRARAMDVRPVSAVGAGDSFVGGMAWSLSAGHSIEDAFRWGVAAGSAAVLNPGTELCHASDVERLYQSIELVHL